MLFNGTYFVAFGVIARFSHDTTATATEALVGKVRAKSCAFGVDQMGISTGVQRFVW